MAKEKISATRVRKSTLPVSNLATANDKDIRLIKIPSKPDAIPSGTGPFSSWSMPPQQDGYLKSSGKDCL